MIDTKMLKFIEMLESVSDRAQSGGIIPFTEWDWLDNAIVYNDKKCIRKKKTDSCTHKYYPIINTKRHGFTIIDDDFKKSFRNNITYWSGDEDYNVAVRVTTYKDREWNEVADVIITVNPATDNSEIVVVPSECGWFIPGDDDY